MRNSKRWTSTPTGRVPLHRGYMEASSVLDLTLTKGALSRQELNWHTIDIGSDYPAIGIMIPTKSDRTIVAPVI
jgi:hypothetical protein